MGTERTPAFFGPLFALRRAGPWWTSSKRRSVGRRPLAPMATTRDEFPNVREVVEQVALARKVPSLGGVGVHGRN